jgi:hypothetical protein
MKYMRTICLVGMIMILSVAGNVHADFGYADFQSISGLSLVGSASQSASRVRLTPATANQSGAVWTNDTQSVGDGFISRFRFQATNIGGVYDLNGNPACDLTSFVVQKVGNNVLDISSYSAATNPRLRILFDANRLNANDPATNSTSVQVWWNGTLGCVTNLESLGIRFRDMTVHQASVIYSQQTLKVLVDNQEAVNLQGIDLNGCGLGQSYIGFQSHNGGNWANQEILSWSFKSVPEPATMMLIGLGGLIVRRVRR